MAMSLPSTLSASLAPTRFSGYGRRMPEFATKQIPVSKIEE
jgi:hypothetical protein